MKQFKKRTIALVLASVVTVVGAFGAENYKNSLMSLKFESTSGGSVDLTLQTKRDYSGTINPIKKDANTYVIMLPEMNSKMASSPELAGDVESVDVKTMPYTTNSKGYTKITVKTASNTKLNAKKAIYVPENTTPKLPSSEDSILNQSPQRPADYNYQPQNNYVPREINYQNPNTIRSRSGVDQTNPVDIKKSIQQFEPPSHSSEEKKAAVEPSKKAMTASSSSAPVSSSDSTETLLLVMAIFLVFVLVIFFYIKGKNKMAEILGEQGDFSIDDDPPPASKKEKKEKKKAKRIRNTINNLDRMYSHSSIIQPEASVEVSIEPDGVEKADEESLVVDLDELFQEKTAQASKDEVDEFENSALEEFLSAYTFDMGEEGEVEQADFDEELYEKYINDNDLKFSKEDVERMEQLLNSEIGDDTLRNIEQFAPPVLEVTKKPSHTEILENFITSYTINQNLTFSHEDVNALYKLISVEIDNDFITDLRTNPERMAEMQREIEKRKEKPHKTSELLTLNVKDMLPDLSEALKNQGGKEIKSEYKPQVVYYSEGYEVSTLSLNDELPDLTIEINNKNAYQSRPSDEIQYVENGYDVDTMALSPEYQDLNDMFKNPEKYEKEESVNVVDEDALLNNIANVTFKPFYDGEEESAITNDFESQEVPSMQDMQEEFNQLGDNFEIMHEEESAAYEEVASLQENEQHLDLDQEIKEELKPEIVENTNPKQVRRDETAAKLLQMIEEQKEERAQKELDLKTNKVEKEPKKEETPIKPDTIKSVVLDGEMFEIVSNVVFSPKTGCYLGKNESGYKVLGYNGSNIFVLKEYKVLKSENIQSRVSEKLENGVLRYIVRIGVHKFILNVSDDNLEYVMDLC